MSKQVWTDEDDKTLRTMIDGGSTFSQIGSALGRSRSAIAGRCGRLGLVSKNPQTIANAAQAALKAKKSAITPVVKQEDPEPIFEEPVTAFVAPTDENEAAGPITILELRHFHCRAVIGSHEELSTFCGKRREPGQPWCAEHRAQYLRVAPPSANRKIYAVPK